jgi:peptide-methionine (S)-S-oxide reductase
MEIIVLGGGCFWCVEAVFSRLKGVTSVLPGYTGGQKENPSYEEVCSGETGHAEVAQIEFDPQIISFEKLLEVFFKTHDPTSLNRQGNDVGTQYRSIILYTSEEQKKLAEEYIENLQKKYLRDDQEVVPYDKKIKTEVQKLEKFYPAEDYHQKYFENHSNLPYCQFVIAPKVEKMEEEFGDILITN